jgi:hypothetical protein
MYEWMTSSVQISSSKEMKYVKEHLIEGWQSFLYCETTEYRDRHAKPSWLWTITPRCGIGTNPLILLDGHVVHTWGGHHVETRRTAHVGAAMLPSEHPPICLGVVSAAASSSSFMHHLTTVFEQRKLSLETCGLAPSKNAAVCSLGSGCGRPQFK